MAFERRQLNRLTQIVDDLVFDVPEAPPPVDTGPIFVTGNVQKPLPVAGCQPVHHRVFPEPVDTHRHHVVHHIVFRGDIGKDSMHQPGLFVLAP